MKCCPPPTPATVLPAGFVTTPASTAYWTRPAKTPMISAMRTVLSYLLLCCLALSGISGSVQPANAYTLADALAEQHLQAQPAAETEMPCHSAKPSVPADPAHDCCEQAQHQCKGDCCTKHCATASALLTTELFRYVRPHNRVAAQTGSLPLWLFAEEPPPPINA